MKKLLALFLVIALAHCSAIRLERALPSDIKAWYRMHSLLMDAKAPKWLNTHRRTEAHHFLRMPERVQRKWMAMFWDIRMEGAEELFCDR